MKKLLILPLLAMIMITSCTIQENCMDCDKKQQAVHDTIVKTVYDTIIERDTIQLPSIVDTLYVETRDTITITETKYCTLDTKHFNFNDFPKGCTEVVFGDIQVDSDGPYTVVDTYAGKGMHIKDGIAFIFDKLGDSVRLDYIYYKAVDHPGNYIYWDNGQTEIPYRSKGEPVFLKIDSWTEGTYIDIKKRSMILLGFGTSTLKCKEE